jgi:lipid-A-disaccharide synthase
VAVLRIGVLAGESSGDILGSRLMSALKARFGDVQFEGMGGPLMEAQGLDSLFPMDRLSVMGFIEPLKRLPELLRIRGSVFRHFRENPPDIFIGIDSPDFTLHLEQKLRRIGVTTAHLVSPSVWAWRKRRIKKIKRAVDIMLCLFPFETDVYREHGIRVAFVGHPLADEIPMRVDPVAAREALGLSSSGKLLALLPGSRGGEVRLLAPLFLQTAQQIKLRQGDLSFVMPAANDARYRELTVLLQAYPDLPVTLVKGRSREVMAAADAVLLASGTATLEAMLLKRPMVIAYRMAAFSWAVISRLLTIKFAGLPNLLAGRALVPEFIQNDATPEAMATALQAQLDSDTQRQELLTQYDLIHRQLALDFSARAAQAIAGLLKEKAG